ncbi:hypothetical protein [Paracraurococcus lichenis]|uniref:4Fe-4S ferredoxin-type domain-containing protein n=1 Tax=Paracraurococcus lichenis TaxID=3064888 RepID=A0ABT9DYA6_9PROT|nr:hypothetical protein [Paracraurococcus sp. LOR1-02]MDO9708893.1 hypothetical protein [Paracraurococcus sp. LOR1-02]
MAHRIPSTACPGRDACEPECPLAAAVTIAIHVVDPAGLARCPACPDRLLCRPTGPASAPWSNA